MFLGFMESTTEKITSMFWKNLKILIDCFM